MKNQRIVISFLSVLFCTLTLTGYSLIYGRDKGLLSENVDALASPEGQSDKNSYEAECSRRGGMYNYALTVVTSSIEIIGEEGDYYKMRVVYDYLCSPSIGDCCIGVGRPRSEVYYIHK